MFSLKAVKVLTHVVLITAFVWIQAMRRNPGEGCQLLYEAFLFLLIDKDTQSLEEIT